jgi:hypothetical protein
VEIVGEAARFASSRHRCKAGRFALHDNLLLNNLQNLLHENLRKKTTFSPIAGQNGLRIVE